MGIKVRKTTLLYTFLVFALVEPNFFKVIASINKLYTAGRIIAEICVLLLFVKMGRKVIFNKLSVFFLLIYVPLFVSTIMHVNRVNDWYRNSIDSILLSVLIIIAFSNETEDSMLRALENLDIYLIVNLATILFFPKGLYKTALYTECWFLGYKNPQIRMVLPIMLFSVLYAYHKYGEISLRAKIDVFVAVLTTILAGSSTGIVGIFLCLSIFIILTNRTIFARYLKRIINYKIVILGIGCIFLFVVWQGSRDNELILYAADFFNKGISFFSRVDFWNKTVQLIADNPIWGYGYLTSADFELMIGNPYAAHPHNYFLYILCCGGVVCFVGIVFTVYYAFESAYRNEAKEIVAITGAYLTSLLVMGLTESLTEFVLLYPSLILILAINFARNCNNSARTAEDETRIEWR